MPCPRKRDQQYFLYNFDKFKCIAVIFSSQHHKDTAKLLIKTSPPHLINDATASCKIEHS